MNFLKASTVMVAATGLFLGTVAMAADAPKKKKDGKDAKKGPATPEALLAHRDTDKDGKLSLEEFKANKDGEQATRAEAQFKRMDKDGDGFVTAEELKTAFAERKQGGPKKDSK